MNQLEPRGLILLSSTELMVPYGKLLLVGIYCFHFDQVACPVTKPFSAFRAFLMNF